MTGVVLSLLFTVSATPSLALVIDAFDEAQTCVAHSGLPLNFSVVPAAVPGNWRFFESHWHSGLNTITAEVDSSGNGLLGVSSGLNTSGNVSLRYWGNFADSIGPVDFTDGGTQDGFQIGIQSNAIPVRITLVVNNSPEYVDQAYSLNLPGGITSPRSIFVPFDAFPVFPDFPVDFTAVDEFHVHFNAALSNQPLTPGTDLKLDFIQTFSSAPPVPEPSTYVLAAFGLLGLGLLVRRRKQIGSDRKHNEHGIQQFRERGICTRAELLARLRLPSLLTAMFVLLLHSSAHAIPVQWLEADGGNGHYYDFVAGNISWIEASEEAENGTFLSRPGHLVTVTSWEEKEFIRLNIGTQRGWLGGFQDTLDPEYSEPSGGWKWITDEPWDFTNWASPEPNEFVSGENYLELDPSANSPDGAGWSDQSVTEHFNAGYYIEYGSPVPEPSTYALAAFSLIGLLAYRRFR